MRCPMAYFFGCSLSGLPAMLAMTDSRTPSPMAGVDLLFFFGTFSCVDIFSWSTQRGIIRPALLGCSRCAGLSREALQGLDSEIVPQPVNAHTGCGPGRNDGVSPAPSCCP